MKTNLTIIIFLLLLMSCASENEKKALDEIANIYSAKTSYSKNFNSSMGKTIEEFNVKVSNSEMLDTLPKGPAASNIAVETYNNLNKEEKEKYSAINVALISKDNDTTKFSYPISILKDVAPKSIVFNDFSNDIVNHRFSALDKYKDKEYIPKSVSGFMEKNIIDRENAFGTLKQYKPVLIIEDDNNILKFVGLLIFKNGKSMVYYTVFDKTKDKNKIKGIHILK